MQKVQQSKILVTGGAGYIGSHTVVELQNKGYEVLIVDDFSNSQEKVLSRIEEISGKPVRCERLNVSDRDPLKRVFLEFRPDAVIHFAGFKAVGESVRKPLKYYRNNLESTLTLLEVMQEVGCKRIIFSSTATVYGTAEKVPVSEEDPTFCTSPYAWTKWMIEQILRDVCVADPEFSASSLRYFNPIGAHPSGLIGENPKGIPNNLMPYITQVAIGKLKQLSVFGNDYQTHDGTGVRDYIHVVDLAQGHIAALDYVAAHPGFVAINLGTGIGYSVLDMVETFQRVNKVEVPYQIVERRPGDVDRYFADPNLAKRLLGWESCLSLDDMCRDSWNWQTKNPEGYGEDA